MWVEHAAVPLRELDRQREVCGRLEASNTHLGKAEREDGSKDDDEIKPVLTHRITDDPAFSSVPSPRRADALEMEIVSDTRVVY
eukprot:1045771-Rhodomonas_salina.2